MSAPTMPELWSPEFWDWLAGGDGEQAPRPAGWRAQALTDGQRAGLEVADHMARHGVPVFLGRPALHADGSWNATGGTGHTGYFFPNGWQHTRARPEVLDQWRPDVAVCAVTGSTVDAIDVDPRSSGLDSYKRLLAEGRYPVSYGHQRTPSGGFHDLVASLGVASRDAVLPGVDVKAGTDQGDGRGFVFIAPTVKLSKETGQLAAYAWTTPPDLTELRDGITDDTGKPLADMIRQTRNGSPSSSAASSNAALVAAFLAPANTHDGPIPAGKRDQILRDYAFMQASKKMHTRRELLALQEARWRDCEQPSGDEYPLADALKKVDTALAKVATGSADGSSAAAELFALKVEDEADKLRVREAARELVALEKRPPVEPFDAGTLTEILARPPEPPARISTLLPWLAAMLLVAQRKTGKSVALLNLAWSVLTGEPFLGRLDVRPVDGTVALLNYEVNPAQIARWASDVGIPSDRFLIVNLRGRRNPLGDPEDRGRLAAFLRSREVETLLVDPFGRAYTGASQNDSGEVGQWLIALDLFARAEVGARDLVLAAHAGWNGERSRGSSALEDWADVVVTMTKDDDDGVRYLRAVGRDVDMDEDRLNFDPSTRRLTLSGGGSRKQAKAVRKTDDLVPLVVQLVTASPGIGINQLRTQAKLHRSAIGGGFQDVDVSRAAKAAVQDGLIRQEGGGPGRKLALHPILGTIR